MGTNLVNGTMIHACLKEIAIPLSDNNGAGIAEYLTTVISLARTVTWNFEAIQRMIQTAQQDNMTFLAKSAKSKICYREDSPASQGSNTTDTDSTSSSVELDWEEDEKKLRIMENIKSNPTELPQRLMNMIKSVAVSITISIPLLQKLFAMSNNNSSNQKELGKRKRAGRPVGTKNKEGSKKVGPKKRQIPNQSLLKFKSTKTVSNIVGSSSSNVEVIDEQISEGLSVDSIESEIQSTSASVETAPNQLNFDVDFDRSHEIPPETPAEILEVLSEHTLESTDNLAFSTSSINEDSVQEDEFTDSIEEEEEITELNEEEFNVIDSDIGSVEEKGVIDAYLDSIQKRIIKEGEGKARKKPREYEDGTFWVHKKNPAFILSNSGHINPKELCPECDNSICVKEYNDKPKGRRVIDIDECTNPSKSKRHSFNGTDERLIRQLSLTLQTEFPAILTYNSGISKRLSKLMRILFQNAVGPHRLSKILRVLQTEKFDEIQLQYYETIGKRIAFQGLQNYEEFCTFRDKSNYAGHSPSSKYLSFVYCSVIEKFVPFMDQLNSQLDGVVLKGDHSFKLIKHVGKTNGVSVFTALYTLMNEYEEIRMQTLAHTKSIKELAGNFDNMMESYKRYNFKMPEVFYTDNVRGDKQLLESYIPSLLTMASSTVSAALKVAELAQLPPASLPSDVAIEIYESIESINCACQLILNEAENKGSVYIGFDCEWDVSRGKKLVALIQIYHPSARKILLIRANQLNSVNFPPALKSIVQQSEVHKIGRNVGADLSRICRAYPPLEAHGALELGSFCKSKEVIETGNSGLDKICGSVLGLYLAKENNVRVSNWEDYLSDAQIKYAALDAYVSYAIYDKVKNMPKVHESVNGRTPVNTFVGIYTETSSNSFPAALGVLCERDDQEIVGLLINSRHPLPTNLRGTSLVRVLKVKIPGTLVNNYPLDVNGNPITLASFGDPPFAVYVRNNLLRTASASVHLGGSTAITVALIPNEAPNSIVINAANADYAGPVTPSSEISHSNTTVPSRVLKDAFHLIDQIKVSMRHGMAKDFKRRFRDCLFVVYEEDKKNVTRYLATIGYTWEAYLVENPDFLWERVRRYIPTADKLYPLVKECFDDYADARCIKTELVLFDAQAKKTAKNILEAIKSGFVSDLVGGPALYTEKGFDKRGLMRYSCSCGTSSVEGSCHFNIIRKFSSFNAGPRLTNMALYDYRLCHNIDMGSKNRHGIIHKSHYSPWLGQAINLLRTKVGHPPRQIYFGSKSLGSVFDYVKTNEKSGITPVPSWFKINCGMEEYKPDTYLPTNISSKFRDNILLAHDLAITYKLTEKSVLQLAALPIANLPASYYSTHQFMYRYLCKCQGTLYAITPVHTSAEVSLYNTLKNDESIFNSSDNIDFDAFARLWSKYCLPTNFIYYKSPEQLQTHFNILEDRQKYYDSVQKNGEISTKIRNMALSSSRFEKSVPALCYQPFIAAPQNLPTPLIPQQTYSRHPLIAPRSNGFYIATTVNQQTTQSLPIPRAPKKCSLCGGGKSVCKGSSRPQLCIKKCGKCRIENCPGRYKLVPCTSTNI
ncbi:unnamed protein product [Mucor hiemalis]